MIGVTYNRSLAGPFGERIQTLYTGWFWFAPTLPGDRQFRTEPALVRGLLRFCLNVNRHSDRKRPITSLHPIPCLRAWDAIGRRSRGRGRQERSGVWGIGVQGEGGRGKVLVSGTSRDSCKVKGLDWDYSDTWKTRAITLGGQSYADYLKSPEWATVKAKAASRPHYKRCYACGATDNLDIHHRSYKWIGTQHAMRGLVALCRDCHGKTHDLAKQRRVSVRRATRQFKRKVLREKAG